MAGPTSHCDVVGGTVLGDAVVDWCALNIHVCVCISVYVCVYPCMFKAVVIQAQAQASHYRSGAHMGAPPPLGQAEGDEL